MTAPVIHWFRQDLRLADNPALAAAAEGGRPVLPVYLLDDATGPLGGAGRWWLHHSLAGLDAALRRAGSRLVLRRGAAAEAIAALAAETGAAAVHFTRRYEAEAIAEEAAVAGVLQPRGVACRRFGGGLLVEPEAVRTAGGTPFRVFTPFHRACRALPPPRDPLPAPSRLPPPDSWPAGERLDDWRLRPTAPDWAGGLAAAWAPGEAGARARLAAFVDGPIADYATTRDRPDVEGTARLSPHLHFGEIGPRQCRQAAAVAAQRLGPGSEAGVEAFLRELHWREFCHHLLAQRPDLPERPFRVEFAAFAWRDDAAGLGAWQRGRTGYPIVDAGLRELWTTGWMHNRVRMIAASFLVKDLLVPWQAGERWFRDTLVDADVASNAANWQWVAGCGADAAPYFRIFNPVTQGRKFDPEGAYVRRWLPELARLPADLIHQPWTAPPATLAAAGVVLGRDYPTPIVEHAAARRRALAAFQALRS